MIHLTTSGFFIFFQKFAFLVKIVRVAEISETFPVYVMGWKKEMPTINNVRQEIGWSVIWKIVTRTCYDNRESEGWD